MKGSLRFLSTFVLVSILAAGCHRKHPAADAGTEGAAPSDPAAVKSGDEKKSPEGEAKSAPTGTKDDARPEAKPTDAPTNDELAVVNPDYEAWFKKYHLDLNDPKMLDADPDGDGYSNREEFLAGTDPRDPKSHPDTHGGVHKTIRLKEYNEVQLPFVLKSVDGDNAKIERLDEGAGKIEEVRTGQTLRGTAYKIEKIQTRRGVDKEGNAVDASHVMLENTGSKEKISLVKDLPTKTSASYAVLTSAKGSETITVRRGDTFNWPGEKDVTYKVLDLGSDQVVLQEVESGKTWTVNKR